MGVDETSEPQLTIDQLAAAVSMTVRNVRAYAGRGLIPPPRLVGRTGYYGAEHVSRLRLVRDLLDRGYTLAAVERVLKRHTNAAADHALDLLNTLEEPLGADQPEEIAVDALLRLAGGERETGLLARLEDMGLVERVDDERLLLLRPFVVRAGAKAMALGLDRESVLALLPLLGDNLHAIAQRFVDEFRAQIWRPFAEDGFPEDEWPAMLDSIRTLLPVASQAVLAVFRNELSQVVEEALGEELGHVADE